MLLDGKGERKNVCDWDEKLREVGREVKFIFFTNKDEDGGKLDGLVVFENGEDG
ncbi:hypothetical protein [Bacillus thuringiensis]|uniref:hypothetical protein n=1 Tax=Bacillus thuringiensis TaxID=1428 RepID=UPI0016427344|nr:hypothetical protein [Bacillus thuringiensis]